MCVVLDVKYYNFECGGFFFFFGIDIFWFKCIEGIDWISL